MQLELSGPWTGFEIELAAIPQAIHKNIDFHLRKLQFEFKSEYTAKEIEEHFN
jgi:hypothetical protein